MGLRLGEEVRLLGTGTERRLLAARLQTVRLENALERLGGRTMAASVTATTCGRGRREVTGHFVLRMRQTFRMNAETKKWSQSLSALLLEFLPSEAASCLRRTIG